MNLNALIFAFETDIKRAVTIIYRNATTNKGKYSNSSLNIQ